MRGKPCLAVEAPLWAVGGPASWEPGLALNSTGILGRGMSRFERGQLRWCCWGPQEP